MCLAACGQPISNLYRAGQVLLTACKIAVCQLASQSVQHVSNASVAVSIDTRVVGDQGYYRAFCCVLDNGVASLIVLVCFAITFMCVVNVSVAAVVVDGQVTAILLEEVACCAIATYELLQRAVMITIIALAFIGPLRTVGKQHIYFTGTVIIVNGTFEIGFVGIHAQGQNALILLLILNQDVAFNLYITVAFNCDNCAILQLGIDGQLAAADNSSTAHSSLDCAAADISGRRLIDIVVRVTTSYGNNIAVIAYIQVNHTGNLQICTAGVFPYFNSIFYLRLAGMEFHSVFPAISIIDGQAGKALAIAIGTLLVGACNVNTAQLASGQKAAGSRKLHTLDVVDHQIGRANMNSIGIYIINVLNTIRLVNVQRNVKTMSLHINGNRFIAGDIDATKVWCR